MRDDWLMRSLVRLRAGLLISAALRSIVSGCFVDQLFVSHCWSV